MRFHVDEELSLFAESVRGAVGPWEPPREPPLGEWWDERDDALAAALASVGWSNLGDDPALLGAAVAGAVELGRACAPVCVVDEVTLGGPLAVEGRVRHGAGVASAVELHGDRAVTVAVEGAVHEPTLDGCGTVRAVTRETEPAVGAGRVRAWCAATLGYAAGLTAASVDAAVAHARHREQFGAPLGALPAVQARLADAVLAAEGIALLAWQAASPAPGDPPLAAASLRWASGTARDVTASMHQVHGAIGFALESGVHRAYRRAISLQAWTVAATSARSVDRERLDRA